MKTADLAAFTEKILNGKLIFLCSDNQKSHFLLIGSRTGPFIALQIQNFY